MTATEEVSEKAPSHSVSRHQEKENRHVLCSCYSLAGARDTNEDVAACARFSAQSTAPTVLAAVADGMGGHGNGETAASLAVQTLFARLHGALLTGGLQDQNPVTADSLRCAFHSANEHLIAYGSFHGHTEGMGTTLVTAVVTGNTCYVSSVGDSRCYCWRNGVLEQLTRDDSFVQELVDAGFLTPDEAECHPRANQITRALGWPQDLDGLTVANHPIQGSELLVLCSDGLWKGAGKALEEACTEADSWEFGQRALDRLAFQLVRGAVERDADDNVSAALVWIRSGEDLPVTREREKTNEED